MPGIPSYSTPAATAPAPIPARVAPSNRAEAWPRSSSLPAVAIAMNPRIDGTEAAVLAPSSRRVPPMTKRSTDAQVRIAAMIPKSGPICMTR